MQGHFELNVFVPLLARNILDSVKLLASASRLFAEKCIDGIEANRENAARYAELTLSAATALNPYIGYDLASEIVKEAGGTEEALDNLRGLFEPRELYQAFQQGITRLWRRKCVQQVQDILPSRLPLICSEPKR
jgi:aspartate ammonia-lyase